MFSNPENIQERKDPDLPAERKKTINANSSSELPVAYLAVNHAYEDTFTWTEEFVDEVLPNGDVYKKYGP